MADHDWGGDAWDDAQAAEAVEVRHVQPYQAEKAYRCPGCDHDIRPGEGHEVVVPRQRPEDRRHWHTGCWHRATKPKRRKGRR